MTFEGWKRWSGNRRNVWNELREGLQKIRTPGKLHCIERPVSVIAEQTINAQLHILLGVNHVSPATIWRL